MLAKILQPARIAITYETLTSGTLTDIWKDLNQKYEESLEMIRHYMNMHSLIGPIPDIMENPHRALMMFAKRQDIQDDLKAFLQFSKDEARCTNLYTEENVVTLASLFPQPPT